MKNEEDYTEQHVNEVPNQPMIPESGPAPSSGVRLQHTDNFDKPTGREEINKSGLGAKPRRKSSGKRGGKRGGKS
jgi:hypothetical protein